MWFFRDSRRVTHLEEDLARLERSFKALEMEWDDTYDKLRRAMGRIVKSRAIIEEKEAAEGGTNGTASPLAASSLTPRQRLIQTQIAALRAARSQNQ